MIVGIGCELFLLTSSLTFIASKRVSSTSHTSYFSFFLVATFDTRPSSTSYIHPSPYDVTTQQPATIPMICFRLAPLIHLPLHSVWSGLVWSGFCLPPSSLPTHLGLLGHGVDTGNLGPWNTLDTEYSISASHRACSPAGSYASPPLARLYIGFSAHCSLLWPLLVFIWCFSLSPLRRFTFPLCPLLCGTVPPQYSLALVRLLSPACLLLAFSLLPDMPVGPLMICFDGMGACFCGVLLRGWTGWAWAGYMDGWDSLWDF